MLLYPCALVIFWVLLPADDWAAGEILCLPLFPGIAWGAPPPQSFLLKQQLARVGIFIELLLAVWL